MVGVNWSSDPLTRVEALAPSPQQGKRGHFLGRPRHETAMWSSSGCARTFATRDPSS